MSAKGATEWPYDLEPAITALQRRGVPEIDLLATLAGALTLLGHPTQVVRREINNWAWERHEAALVKGRRAVDEPITAHYALALGNRVMSLHQDSSWKEILERSHRAWRPAEFKADRMDWESRFAGSAQEIDCNPAEELVQESAALMRASPTGARLPTRLSTTVTPAVAQVLHDSHYGSDMLAGILADALRKKGLEATARHSCEVNTIDGVIATQTSCWVEIGAAAERLWFAAHGDEMNLKFVTPNPRGAWGMAQPKHGEREIHIPEDLCGLRDPQLPYLQVAPLVADILQRHLEDTVAPVHAERARPRM